MRDGGIKKRRTQGNGLKGSEKKGTEAAEGAVSGGGARRGTSVARRFKKKERKGVVVGVGLKISGA